ncbi:MAG: J domain-containing protein [Clostridia bacterium]
MTDPYKVLGVSASSTDEEIKDAYRTLAKKYHPDQYSGSPIADLASEKMKEINEAYDEVVASRKNKSSNNSRYQQNSYNGANNSSSSYSDVRSFINTGRIADAEQILNGVPTERRNAEWYFLKGSVLYRRGWLEEAKQNFARACQMDPSNMEYRSALNQSMNQRAGAYGGYNPNMQRGYGNNCNSCDMCSSLMCADCCCECMGGDLIACC